jgi:hypothetical protein
LKVTTPCTQIKHFEKHKERHKENIGKNLHFSRLDVFVIVSRM